MSLKFLANFFMGLMQELLLQVSLHPVRSLWECERNVTP